MQTPQVLPDAFYEPEGAAAYRATPATMSPWDPRLQHGGPPCALAVHALEDAFPRPDMRIARLVVDFLGPIPLDVLTVQVDVVRSGKRIELARAVLASGGRAVVTAQAWRIAVREPIDVPQAVLRRQDAEVPPPLPAAQPDVSFAGFDDWPYGRAIEWRFISGGFRDVGPAEVWTRPRLPLVTGMPLRAIERVALVADSANGLSREFDFERYVFVPPSIVITLDRYPAADWTYMHATTHLAPDGIGFTTCALGDENGRFGIATQALLVEPRG